MAADAALQRPTIHTTRLTLRPLEMTDAPAVKRYVSRIEVAQMTSRIPHPYPENGAEDFIRRATEKPPGQDFVFALAPRESGELIGAAGLHPDLDHKNAELGYWIGVEHWGKGYATEAALALVRFGFESAGLHKIHAGFYSHNPASGRVLEKCGFRQEGIRREQYLKFGRWVDLVVVGLLRREWLAMQTDGGLRP